MATIAGYFVLLADGRKHWLWRQAGESDESLLARAQSFAEGQPGSVVKPHYEAPSI
ncbi:MAG: hypothetical protein KQJ78_07640 [Deltaproteobacteria bacterium]|nr:hypothetical protein [Deltaproteobacteria bacterium]